VATPDLAALRAQRELADGGGNYISVYFTERDMEETRELMAVLSKRLREQNRFVDYFRGVFRGNFSLDACTLRSDLVIAPGAVPVMPHKGVYITVDDLLDSTQEKRLIEKYDKNEVPAILECPGVAAAFRFRCMEQPYLNRILHFYFLDGDPAGAAKEINRRLANQGALRELPGLSGVARRLFAGPYRTIIPLQHDFLAPENCKKQR